MRFLLSTILVAGVATLHGCKGCKDKQTTESPSQTEVSGENKRDSSLSSTTDDDEMINSYGATVRRTSAENGCKSDPFMDKILSKPEESNKRSDAEVVQSLVLHRQIQGLPVTEEQMRSVGTSLKSVEINGLTRKIKTNDEWALNRLRQNRERGNDRVSKLNAWATERKKNNKNTYDKAVKEEETARAKWAEEDAAAFEEFESLIQKSMSEDAKKPRLHGQEATLQSILGLKHLEEEIKFAVDATTVKDIDDKAKQWSVHANKIRRHLQSYVAKKSQIRQAVGCDGYIALGENSIAVIEAMAKYAAGDFVDGAAVVESFSELLSAIKNTVADGYADNMEKESVRAKKIKNLE